MEYRTFDKLGVKVSLLGYGCMRFPTKADGTIDEAEAEKLLDKAYAAGVNYFDTAYPYHNGESELVVGRIMKKYDRNSFHLATKLPVWFVKTVEDVDRLLNEQLEKLQTDYIDFYLMHALNKDKWHEMVSVGCVERLVELQKQGKIKHLGFSFHDGYEAFEEIITYRDWDFCQIQFNYMDCDEQASWKGYDLAKKLNVPLIIMEPVKGGTLTRFSDDIMEKFAAIDPNASAASFALRWVGTFDNCKVILSGMTTMEQLDDNLKTFGEFKPMDQAELDAIDDIKKAILSRTKNGCTGCRYCMPCPMGVDIPASFSCWNRLNMYGNYYAVNWTWETEMSEAKQPKNCVECGKCEKACPQQIPIREHLKQAQADIDAAAAAAKN